jgi:hypothetical protein
LNFAAVKTSSLTLSLVYEVFIFFLFPFQCCHTKTDVGLGILLFTTASRPALGPTQLPIQWVPGVLSLGIKRPGREAEHSPPSIAGVKECVELYLHSPDTPSWGGA